MSIGVRRLVAALVAVLAAVLSGCTASGVVEVRSADEVMIDVTLTHALDENACDTSGFRPDVQLTVTAGVDDNQRPTCHIVGTVPPEQLRDYLTVSHAGEFLVASFNPLGVVPGVDAPSGTVLSAFTALDLVVRFPGQVQSATGEWDGNAAHFRDPKQFIRPYGLRAEALDHPGPAWSVVGPIVGFVAGAAAAGLAFALWRRRSVGDSGEDPEELASMPDGERPAGGPASPGEWPLTDEPSPDEPSLDERLSDERLSLVESAASGERSTPPVSEYEPSEGPRRRPDDSVWAPPGDP